MNEQQKPLGSGFTAASTADDVLRGIDLSGKNVIVTGGHAGLGLETTRALAKAGASVTVAARDPERAERAVEGVARVEVSQLDLIDPTSIDAFVARWLAAGRPLHVLVNNAAPTPSKVIERDSRGYEVQFSASHLGHFQLTVGLHPALLAARGARVINVSSGAQRFGVIRWDDPVFTNAHDYDSRVAYAQSKKANVLFAVELDSRWSNDGIRGYAVHPGVVTGTALNSAAGPEALRAMGLIDEAGEPIIDPAKGKKTIPQGASTTVFAATSPLLANIGGVYLMDNDISRIDDEPRTLTATERIPADVHSSSIDPDAAKRLWELSEQLLRRRSTQSPRRPGS
jgi:NAD(P)-dependent dehydrogenase (short-subunit alcohol dehydrogenase family)